jgi:hypothetical protein
LPKVNAFIDRDPRLDLRDLHDRVPHVAAQPLQLIYTRLGRAAWKRSAALEDKNAGRDPGQGDYHQSKRPSEMSPQRRPIVHSPKKYRPPHPNGREGRLFPPEQS